MKSGFSAETTGTWNLEELHLHGAKLGDPNRCDFPKGSQASSGFGEKRIVQSSPLIRTRCPHVGVLSLDGRHRKGEKQRAPILTAEREISKR